MKILKLSNNTWIWCALALPAIIILSLILHAGANAPVWDDYAILYLYRGLIEGEKGLTDILQFQINEHRVIVPAIIEMIIWALTNCNQLIVALSGAVPGGREAGAVQQPRRAQHKALCDGQEELAILQYPGRGPVQRCDLQSD